MDSLNKDISILDQIDDVKSLLRRGRVMKSKLCRFFGISYYMLQKHIGEPKYTPTFGKRGPKPREIRA